MLIKPSIGILAYGSLIDEPGNEIQPLIFNKIPCITPFKVEFARMSKSRDFAPTLVPVTKGGAHVKAIILILDENVSLSHAESMLWRRETRQNDLSKNYKRKANIGSNTVEIKCLDHFEGIDKVLYTSIAPNIVICNSAILAKLAIDSILSEAGEKKLDGIRYLLSAQKNGIVTELSNEYEQRILSIAQTQNLEDAIAKFDIERPNHL